jgi:hypothetical protein
MILVTILLAVMGLYYFTMSNWSSRSIAGVQPSETSKIAAPAETTTKTETQPAENKKPRFAAIERTYEIKLHNAVLSAKMNVQCGPNSGNKDLQTPTQAAAYLVKVMNATSAANSSQHNSRSPTITYALNEGDKDWQVVVLPDDDLNRIVIEGYHELSKEPVAVGEISCR